MADCRGNIKYNCPPGQNARCVDYDGELAKFSELKRGCTNLDETTTELYKKLQEVIDGLDITELGNKCLKYEPYRTKKDLTVANVLRTFEEEICKLKDQKSKDKHVYDTKCLEDKCNKSLDTQEQIIQALIDKVCNLESRVKVLESKI
jgi:hypothetical protein